MTKRHLRSARACFRVLDGASLLALLIGGASAGHAQALQPSYSPAANNGGGADPARADILNLTAVNSTITGDYSLRGTSARRFQYDTASIATRNQRGEVLSGYTAVNGRSSLAIGAEQKTRSVTYPDIIQGTNVATLVYDNDLLTETPSTDTRQTTYSDTNAPVYGDLRLANISQSNVTIATGDKSRSVYDNTNFALLTADSGSTLYNVVNNSNIIYDSRTATMDGSDQNGLSQGSSTTINAPVTSYTGVTFGGNDSVTDLASFKRYNSSLIQQLTVGTITPQDYENRIRAAFTTTLQPVEVSTPAIPTYTAPPTVSDRLFLRLDQSNLTTTVDSELVGVGVADGNDAGVSTLISAFNGSTIVNNGTIAQAQGGPGIRLTGAGTSLTNSATGVIGVGYETLDRSSGQPMPSGFSDYLGQSTGNIAIRAVDSASVANQGIINVANRDIPNHDEVPAFGKANDGIVTSGGATATNSGTILIGGANSAVANTLGLFNGASGMVAFNGGTAINAAAGTIRVGTSFAGNAGELLTVTDVLSTNFASGMASLSGGGLIVNDGQIRIGSLAQNATGMMVGGDGNSAVNNGTIRIDATGLQAPSARNVAISVLGSSVSGALGATNSATGRIDVSGVNSIGLLVENGVAGGSARAVNAGTITINGGISVDRLRNYGVFVANAASSAEQDGAVILQSDGAIGVHARNGGTIDVGTAGTLDFRGQNQIGYYVLGAGSAINIASVTDVDTSGSTGLRVEGGATVSGTGVVMNVSGANAYGFVATGASSGTTLDATGALLTVSGPGATGILIEGGATGLIAGATTIALTGNGTTAAIVDGEAHALDGTAVGAPQAGTSLASSAQINSSFDDLTGYVVRNRAQLSNSGAVAFTGARGTGILVNSGGTASNSGTISIASGGAGLSLVSASVNDAVAATNSGQITVTGVGGIGIAVAGAGAAAVHSGAVNVTGAGTAVSITGGGLFTNQGSVTVASGTGILVDGAGSTLAGTGSGAVTVNDGIAALRLVNGASVNSAGSFTAGGTADAILVDAGAGNLTLGNGVVTAAGAGSGIENLGGSPIRLNGTTVAATGAGSAIRTGVALDAGSTGTITAAGTNSVGLDFSGPAGAQIAGDLALGDGLTINASGTGATAVRLATTGNVSLGGTIAVTSAQGGSAVVAGPAAMVVNSGRLTSISAAAPVVDLTGGTRAFGNSGTIAAASSGGTAIFGGDTGQLVTMTAGSVTGAIRLGSGADTFTMAGGTVAGAITTGAGNDSAQFRGLTDANMSAITSIDGAGTAAGSDTLTFDATSSTGTLRLTGWNRIDLVNQARLTADGDLVLAGGSLAIDPTSTFSAGNGANAILRSAPGGATAVTNAGLIDLTNGSTGATDRLTIRGNYVGQNGALRLDTVLGGDGSASDRLIIDGGAVSGRTSVQIVNAGGLGALTTGDGIEVISAVNGGTTTATTTRDGFALASGHVDAGAYEYRLFASNTAGTNESWYLRSLASTPAPTPTPTPTPSTPVAYRVEAALLAALPGELAGRDLAMVSTYHQRMGDQTGDVGQGFTVPGRVWGRFIAEDSRLSYGGDVRPRTNGSFRGGQIGVDLARFGSATGHHDLGIYGGYLDGNARVTGFASGVEDTYVGRLKPHSTYLGGYWTYLANSGFYFDVVVQRSWYGGRAAAVSGNRIPIDGTGILFSLESGYGMRLSPVWTLEPQAQIVAQGLSLDDVDIPNAGVSQHSSGSVTGRLGARIKGDFETSTGSVQPYLRVNVWKTFKTTDRTTFITPAATTVIRTPFSSLRGEAGAGVTWSLSHRIAIYGEVDHRFTLDHGQGVVGHSTGGSIGVRAAF